MADIGRLRSKSKWEVVSSFSFRDNASAALLVVPILYSIVRVYPNNFWTKYCCLGVWITCWKSSFKLRMIRTNYEEPSQEVLPSFLHLFGNCIEFFYICRIAPHTNPYFFAKVSSWLSLCINIGPIPILDVLVSSTNVTSKFGSRNTGVNVITFLSLSMVVTASSDQIKASLWSKYVNGVANVAYFLINLR